MRDVVAEYQRLIMEHGAQRRAALIALPLDALSSDKKMEFDLSQEGAFPAIDS